MRAVKKKHENDNILLENRIAAFFSSQLFDKFFQFESIKYRANSKKVNLNAKRYKIV